jgi:hypothetical protein
VNQDRLPEPSLRVADGPRARPAAAATPAILDTVAAHAAAGPALPRAELALVLLVVVLLVGWKTAPHLQPLLFNDSFVFFSAAREALLGHIGQTTIVELPVERLQQRLPAALVSIPPGYGLAVGAAGAAGLGFGRAALLVSLLATLASVLLVARIAARLLPTRGWVRAVVLLFALNAYVLKYASSALAEALFTCAALCGAAALLESRYRAARSPASFGWALLAGFAFGASAWIRTPGAFLVAGLVALALVGALRRRPDAAIRDLLAACAGGVLLGLEALRNLRLSGDWRGGDAQRVAHSTADLAQAASRAADDLLFGSAPFALRVGARAVFAAALLALLWPTLRALVARASGRPGPGGGLVPLPAGAAALATLGAAFVAGCVAFSFDSLVQTTGVRLFAPAIPFALLTIAAAAAWWCPPLALTRPSLSRVAVCALLGSYAWSNLAWFRDVPALADPQALAARLQRADEAGISARERILAAAGPRGVLLANEGPIAAWVLDRPTVAIVPPPYAPAAWDEAQVRDAIATYGVRVLLVNAPPAGAGSVPLPSPFLDALLAGTVPPWLEVIVRTPDLVALRPGHPARSASIKAP